MYLDDSFKLNLAISRIFKPCTLYKYSQTNVKLLKESILVAFVLNSASRMFTVYTSGRITTLLEVMIERHFLHILALSSTTVLDQRVLHPL